jgi:predicted short-subunit dehydrogenase-like oxidoreductase (DUF2520 family)
MTPGSDHVRVRVRVIGRGRAGGALEKALTDEGSLEMLPSLGHADDPTDAAAGADLLVLAVPDAAIASVAQRIAVNPDTVVVHLSGATPLDALLPHERRASLHPLVTISNAIDGSRLLRGAWMAVSGDPVIDVVARALDARVVRVAEADRVRYHATATIASNHLVALLGQVERVAATVGVPLDAYFDLATTALENARRLGPAAALTGPVSRADWGVVGKHVGCLPVDETEAYLALARAAARLAGRRFPDELVG